MADLDDRDRYAHLFNRLLRNVRGSNPRDVCRPPVSNRDPYRSGNIPADERAYDWDRTSDLSLTMRRLFQIELRRHEADGRDRTGDLFLTKEVRFHLRYISELLGRDSNTQT